MRKWMTGIFAFVFCILTVTVDVQADLIWEPQNFFYKIHTDDCIYHNRNYIANGPDGNVIVYESPEVALELKTLENGTKVNVYYIYEAKNGVQWGIYDNWDENITGWMPMAYLDLVYDHICFEEEFGDQIKNETAELPAEYLGREIRIWTCPGSKDSTTFTAASPIEFQCVFQDEEGHNWGYVGYYRGARDIWVCLDNPQAEFAALYPGEVPVREVNEDDVDISTEKIVPSQSPFGMVMIVGILIAALVFVTWKMLSKMKKK